MDFIGARITSLAPGFCEIEVASRRELTQQHGFVHGGVLARSRFGRGLRGVQLIPAGATILTVEYSSTSSVRDGEAMIARGRW